MSLSTQVDRQVTTVSMGNPHAIIFVDKLSDVDFEEEGPNLENCIDIFPAKTNVEYVEVLSDTHLKMKVWERGENLNSSFWSLEFHFTI